jgi:cytoskeleton protein RodZ
MFTAVGGSVAEGADAAASTAADLSASGVALAVQAASAVPSVAASAVGLLAPSAASTAPPPVPSAVVDTVHSAPQDEPSASAPVAAASGSVVLRTTAESWVEVRDANGAALLSRMLLPGEAVGLNGALPMKLKIGNADGTRVSLHGQPVDLQPFTRDNVARLELK